MSLRSRLAGTVAATLAASAAALAVATWYSRRAVREAERRCPAAGALVDAEGARLHYLEAGVGRPLVLIHGADGVLQGFTETVFAQLARDHRAIAFDRPGHGYSSAPSGERLDVGANARVLRAAAMELGVRDPIVVGHSYGGAVALRWALDHPGELAGLVLLAPAGYFTWPRATPLLMALPGVPLLGPMLAEALVVPLGRAVLPPAMKRGFEPGPVPEAYASYASALFLRPSQFSALASEYRHLRSDLLAMDARYGDIGVPVEIVVGDCDRVTVPGPQAQRLAQAIPNARLTTLPGVGHELQWARPDAVTDAVHRVESRLGGFLGKA